MHQQPILQPPSTVLALRWFTAFTLFFILLLTVSTVRASEVWQTLGGAGFSAGVADYTSLAISPDGKPYVAYRDYGNSSKATVMRLNAAGTAWEIIGNAGFSAGQAVYTSLAISPDGKPYVAYWDGGNSGKATVMQLDATGTAWENVGNAGFSADAAVDISLAISPDGKPYVAYQDGGNANKATVMQLDAAGTAWEIVGNAGFSAGVAEYISLAISPDGKPYVAYQDGGNARVMRLDATGTAWEIVGNAGFSAGVAEYISLAISPDGKPYVAYQDGGNANKATVMQLDATDTAWVNVGNAGFSAGTVAYTSLAISPIDGKPYVAYQDGGNSGKATVMQLNAAGTGWENVGNAGFSAGFTNYPSLAINPIDGKSYVAYTDGGNSNKATVMRLITAPNAPAAPSATLSNNQATITWTAPSSDGGSPIQSYTVTASPGGATCTVAAASTSCVISSLAGTTYTFTVTATNAIGTSPASLPGSASVFAVTTQAIPTLNAWALAVLAFAMAGLAFLTRKRIQKKWAA